LFLAFAQATLPIYFHRASQMPINNRTSFGHSSRGAIAAHLQCCSGKNDNKAEWSTLKEMHAA
jgi:hypothetical protein